MIADSSFRAPGELLSTPYTSNTTETLEPDRPDPMKLYSEGKLTVEDTL